MAPYIAAFYLREMDRLGVDHYENSEDSVTRFECERVLGLNDDE